MILNNNQIQQLLTVVDAQFLIFIIQNVGASVLTENDKEILKVYGIDPDKYDSEFPPVAQAYYFGKLAQGLGKQRTDTLVYSDLLSYFQKGQYMNPTPKDNYVLEALKNQSYSAIKGLENKVKQDINGTITVKDMQYRKEYEESIRDATKRAILNRKYVKEIVSEVGNKYGEWSRDLGRVAETELQNSYQVGKAMEIEAKGGKDALVYKTVFDLACRHCIRLYLTEGIGSKPKVFKLSTLIANGTNVGLKVADWKPVVSSTHPFCFNSKTTKILTSKGYVNIIDVKVGDLVMTHRDRFRRVTKLIRNEAKSYANTEVFNITLKKSGDSYVKSTRRLKKITSSHPVLTQRGWVAAGDIKMGDKLFYKEVKYEKCDEYMNVLPVSFKRKEGNDIRSICTSCVNRDTVNGQWANDEIAQKMKSGVSKWNTERMAKMTIEERRAATSKAREVFNEKYPDKRPWMEDVIKKANQTNGAKKTFIERKLHYFIDKIGIKYEINKFIKNENGDFLNNVKGYFPDIYIPSLNIVIEADGEHWHKDNGKYDKNRDIDIKRAIGADTFRFKGDDIKNNGDIVFNEIKAILKNHSGHFRNSEIEVIDIEKFTIGKYAKSTLYNFSVDEDESYVADGFVVHNCRCELNDVPKNYDWNDEKKDFVPVARKETKRDRPKIEIMVGDKKFMV